MILFRERDFNHGKQLKIWTYTNYVASGRSKSNTGKISAGQQIQLAITFDWIDIFRYFFRDKFTNLSKLDSRIAFFSFWRSRESSWPTLNSPKGDFFLLHWEGLPRLLKYPQTPQIFIFLKKGKILGFLLKFPQISSIWTIKKFW